MAKLTLTDVSSSYRSQAALNANFDAIEAALENTLSLDGTAPNAMTVNLDMGSNRVINVTDPVNNQDGATKAYVDGLADTIADINAITHVDGVFIVSDGTDWVGESGATARASLGLVIGTDVQAHDAGLDDIAALAVTDGNIIVGDGANWVAESGATARASLGLTIGTDVQAYDAGLLSIAGLTTAADKMIYTTASDTYATADLTSFARTLLDDTTAAAARTTLGVDNLTPDYAVDTVAAMKALTSGDVSDGALIHVRGYSAKADGGDRFVKYDASSAATANDVTVFTPDTLAGRFLHLGAVHPEHAGAFESAADNQAALERLADADVDCDGRNRTYAVTTTQSVSGITAVVDLTNGQTNDFSARWSNMKIDASGISTAAGDVSVLFGIGTNMASALALTASPSAGDTTATVADSSSLSAGDIVVIYDNATWNTVGRKSEWNEVASESAGTVTFRHALKGDYNHSSGGSIQKVESSFAPDFDTLTIIGNDDQSASTGMRGATLVGTVGMRSRDFKTVNCGEAGFDLRWPVHADVDGTSIINASQDGEGYGVATYGGYGGSYGDIKGQSCRHTFTANHASSSFSGYGPTNVIAREVSIGDVHCVDAVGAVADTHPGCCDFTFGNITGSMRDDIDEEKVTMEGARITVGDINVTGGDGDVGIDISTNGCGDEGRENFVHIGNVASDTADDTAAQQAFQLRNSGTDTLESVVIGSINLRQYRGLVILPTSGDIGHVTINGGYINCASASNAALSAIEVQDTTANRLKRLTCFGMTLKGDFTAGSAYPVYLNTNSWYDQRVTDTDFAAGDLKFVTIADFYGCTLESTSDNLVASVRDSLLRFHGCQFIGGAAGELFDVKSTTSATCPVGTIQVDGNADLQVEAKSGICDVIPGAMVKMEGEGSASDTIFQLDLAEDLFDNNAGSYSLLYSEGLAPIVTIAPRTSGQNITLQHHNSTTFGRIICPEGDDLVLSSLSDFAVLQLNSDISGSTANGQWVVIATSVNTLRTETATNIADVTHDVNTAARKKAGWVVYDTTNNRLMVSSGNADASAWHVADGSASVTPA